MGGYAVTKPPRLLQHLHVQATNDSHMDDALDAEPAAAIDVDAEHIPAKKPRTETLVSF